MKYYTTNRRCWVNENRICDSRCTHCYFADDILVLECGLLGKVSIFEYQEVDDENSSCKHKQKK